MNKSLSPSAGVLYGVFAGLGIYGFVILVGLYFLGFFDAIVTLEAKGKQYQAEALACEETLAVTNQTFDQLRKQLRDEGRCIEVIIDCDDLDGAK
jgi:hypothetical protein